jgi:hypothetical protein
MRKRASTPVHRRVNRALPEETIQFVDAKLRQLLEEGAERRAARDLAIAEEWFSVSPSPDENSRRRA